MCWGARAGGCVIQNYRIARWGCEVDEVMKSNSVFSINILQHERVLEFRVYNLKGFRVHGHNQKDHVTSIAFKRKRKKDKVGPVILYGGKNKHKCKIIVGRCGGGIKEGF